MSSIWSIVCSKCFTCLQSNHPGYLATSMKFLSLKKSNHQKYSIFFVKGRTIIFNYMQSCMQKNEKKHEKWDCGSQVSLDEWWNDALLKIQSGSRWCYLSLSFLFWVPWTFLTNFPIYYFCIFLSSLFFRRTQTILSSFKFMLVGKENCQIRNMK